MPGIYIHIPFCKKACTYCNFHFSTSLKHKDEMIEAIMLELVLQKQLYGDTLVDTIYLGGGTPSLLSADEIKRITGQIYKHYTIAPDGLKEFTIETNPDDLTTAYIQSLKDTEVNRFSIGVQSFRDTDLQYMNRAHNARQADYAIKAAQDTGFVNLTIDLIYGTPGLSDADWKNNLDKVRELGIPHFSSYALTVEEGTALHHNIAKKKTVPVDAEQSARQFEILMEAAPELGFEHYEISNFAKQGMYAIHNTNYWRGIPYIGIGPSAHSYDGNNRRRWNIANNALYLKHILQESKIPFEEETLTDEQRLNEYILTSLRTMWGCSLQHITTEWGETIAKRTLKTAQYYIESGDMINDNDHLILTTKGKLFADGIAAALFA